MWLAALAPQKFAAKLTGFVAHAPAGPAFSRIQECSQSAFRRPWTPAHALRGLLPRKRKGRNTCKHIFAMQVLPPPEARTTGRHGSLFRVPARYRPSYVRCRPPDRVQRAQCYFGPPGNRRDAVLGADTRTFLGGCRPSGSGFGCIVRPPCYVGSERSAFGGTGPFFFFFQARTPSGASWFRIPGTIEASSWCWEMLEKTIGRHTTTTAASHAPVFSRAVCPPPWDGPESVRRTWILATANDLESMVGAR